VLELLAERLAPFLREELARMPTPSERQWLNTKQAAEHLGMTTDALHKLTAARAVPFEQEGPGCKCWFQRSDLDHWRQHGGRVGCELARGRQK